VGLLVFDVKYGLLLAVIAGVFTVIPIFGTVLSSIPIVAIAILPTTASIGARPGGARLDHRRALLESSFLGPKNHGSAGPHAPGAGDLRAHRRRQQLRRGRAPSWRCPSASIIQTLFVYFRTRAWRIDRPPARRCRCRR
jgi:hypothetical protein